LRLLLLLGALHFQILLLGAGFRPALGRIGILLILGILRRRRGRGAGLHRRCRRPGCALANLLTVVETDHHDDELRPLRCDEFARDLRPFDVALGIVTHQPGIGAVLAHDPEFRLLRKSVFESVGEPVRHAVSQHEHGRRDGGGRIRRPARGRRSARGIHHDRLRPRLRSLVASEPAAEWIVLLLLLLALRLSRLRRSERAPELRRRRHQQRSADADDGGGPCDRADDGTPLRTPLHNRLHNQFR
jgi:hypothetical protein